MQTQCNEVRRYIRLMNKKDKFYGNNAVKDGLDSYYDAVILKEIFDEDDGVTQHRISEITGICKQTVNFITKKFEKKGYIVFETNEKDKRSKIIRFTKYGYDFAKTIILPITDAENQSMNSLTKEERDEFLRLTEKYINGLYENKC